MYGVPDFYQNDNVKKGTGMQWRHQVVSDLPIIDACAKTVICPYVLLSCTRKKKKKNYVCTRKKKKKNYVYDYYVRFLASL